MTEQRRLIDKKTLCELHPAFNKWTLEYLIRTRRIPIVRVGGRRVFFDEIEIAEWISKHIIRPKGGK